MLANLLGVRLIVWAGPVPVPTSSALLQAIESLEVERSADEQGGFQITLRAEKSVGGEYDLLINPQLAVGSRVVIGVLSGFNRYGALRIGVGMVPRGEVALIIAGIGLTSGAITQDIFGVAILMTVVTTLLGPSLLSATIARRRTRPMRRHRPHSSRSAICSCWW